MLRKIRDIFSPTRGLEGLEDILSKVASGQLTVNDASHQIQSLATISLFPLWLPRLFRVMGVVSVVFGIGFGCYSIVFAIGTEDAPGIVTQMKGGSPVVGFEVGNKPYSFQSPFHRPRPNTKSEIPSKCCTIRAIPSRLRSTRSLNAGCFQSLFLR